MKNKRLDFSAALTLLKNGIRVSRDGWENNGGENMFIYLVEGSTFKVNRPPLDQFYKPGTKIDYRPHIDMRDDCGKCVPWTPTQTDILADDWRVSLFERKSGSLFDLPDEDEDQV